MENNLADPLIREKLTDSQFEAVLHKDSPLLIIAGPSSGKTEVIAWRVAHLVQSGRAKPEEILALSFTNKAALSLKDSIQQKLPKINAESMQGFTFHSFCAELLRPFFSLSGPILVIGRQPQPNTP
jgi:DNA helicase-2/ATP-dependent DNA helicase PcrA